MWNIIVQEYSYLPASYSSSIWAGPKDIVMQLVLMMLSFFLAELIIMLR